MPGVLKHWNGTEWVPALGAPSGRTGPLAIRHYNPGTAALTVAPTATPAPVDLANISVTFVVPPSGQVLIEASAVINTANSQFMSWLLWTDGAEAPGTRQFIGFSGTDWIGRPRVTWHLTNLTPGTTVTYALAHMKSGGSAWTRYGGDEGPASLFVWDAVGTAGPSTGTAIGVRAGRSAVLSIPHDTFTAVPWDTENYDHTTPIHDAVTNPTRLTVPAGLAGLWRVSTNLGYAGGTGRRGAAIRLNGATYVATRLSPSAGAGFNSGVGVETEYRLVAGDFVEIMAFQDSGGAINLINGDVTNVSMSFLGA